MKKTTNVEMWGDYKRKQWVWWEKPGGGGRHGRGMWRVMKRAWPYMHMTGTHGGGGHMGHMCNGILILGKT